MCLKTLRIDAEGLIVPQGYSDLTTAQKILICNGMGPKGWSWLVPNHFFGADITEAGNRHDFSYSIGGDKWAKVVADLMFLFNMLRLVFDEGGWMQTPRYFMALRYFTAVFWGGSKSFNFIE